MSILIKAASKTELPLIRQLALNIWPATYSSILSQEQLGYMLDLFYSMDALEKDFEKPGYQFYILRYDDQPAGYAGLEVRENQTAHLHKIYLLSTLQGKGLGKAFIRFLEQAAQKSGATQLTLNVNRHNRALQFYESQGFETVTEVDVPIGSGYFMNDYVMKKKIIQSY